jgi:hypothetical protein
MQQAGLDQHLMLLLLCFSSFSFLNENKINNTTNGIYRPRLLVAFSYAVFELSIKSNTLGISHVSSSVMWWKFKTTEELFIHGGFFNIEI